jgi:6-phosphogluconolactonase
MSVEQPVLPSRELLKTAALVLVALGCTVGDRACAATASPKDETHGTMWLYVGTYTSGKSTSKGIYLLELDPASGAVVNKGTAAKLTDPSFLAIHPSRKFLYAVNELDEINGKQGGGVSALAVDPTTGMLSLLNQQSSVGSGPCHLTVDGTGRNVLVANYGSGSVACLPVQSDGSLNRATAFIQHEGKSVDPSRQRSPHAHSINLDPGNKFAFAADLGLDKILIYRFDAERGLLAPNNPAFALVAPGSGPRHLAFHPSGRFAYVISEMANTLTGFSYDAEDGTLSEIQSISTLPAEYKGRSYTAEVQVHPTGKFVYGSNRGHDSIAIFTADPVTGKLAVKGFESTQGKNPRNFIVDPSGNYLLAENQDSDSIAVFRINAETGELRSVGEPVHIPRPVCIRMIAKPRSGN